MIKCPVQSLKLADFGLAVAVREPLFTVCGTPTYVAPEILAETGYGVKVSPGMHFLENQNYFFSHLFWLGVVIDVDAECVGRFASGDKVDNIWKCNLEQFCTRCI